MSMDMIRGKEKNIIISREKKTRFICFPLPGFSFFFVGWVDDDAGREEKKKFVST